MRFSEAIRLGAMLRPQAFGQLFKNGGSCALGAAMEAVGITKNSMCLWDRNPWKDVNEKYLTHCPVCTNTNRFSIISHLNDDHGWTRERIADWVETVEPVEAVNSEPVAALATVLA